jgi:hypothetical protein
MFLLAAVAGIAILLPVPASTAEKTFERSFTVSSGGELVVTTDVGDVTVTADGASTVRVLVKMKGKESDLEKIALDARETGGGVEVTGKVGKSGWKFWENTNAELRFTIAVPKEYNVRLSTAGGDLGVNGLTGRLEAQTSGGDVRVASVEGRMNVETSGGDITVDNSAGDLIAQTSGGDIRIGGAKGRLELSTSGGDIQARDVDGRITAETSGGNIVIAATGQNQGIAAETSGGNIDISIGKGTGATIEAVTLGGEVSCDLPVTVQGKLSEGAIRGTINGGGNPIRARTSGGDVRIRGI